MDAGQPPLLVLTSGGSINLGGLHRPRRLGVGRSGSATRASCECSNAVDDRSRARDTRFTLPLAGAQEPDTRVAATFDWHSEGTLVVTATRTRGARPRSHSAEGSHHGQSHDRAMSTRSREPLSRHPRPESRDRRESSFSCSSGRRAVASPPRCGWWRPGWSRSPAARGHRRPVVNDPDRWRPFPSSSRTRPRLRDEI